MVALTAPAAQLRLRQLTGPLSVLAIILAAVLALWAAGLAGDIMDHWDDILYLTQQQIVLVAISGGLAIVTGVPLGTLLSRPAFRGVAETVMQVLNIGTTVPTLAVLALSMSFLGIGPRPAIIALWVATLLPIVRNTYIGLLEVPRHLIESATGMGMQPRQILLRVELPNAAWVIFAGIRTAVTINVGTAPLAFLIGGGGLGQLIFTGIDLDDTGVLLAGAIPTALLAVAIDFLIATAGRAIISRGVVPKD